MDLRRALIEETVADVGFRDLVQVDEQASIREVVELMQRESVGCVVVLREAELVGIFTERDLVVRILGGPGGLEDRVGAHMTPDPQVTCSRDPIHRALARMHEGGMRHLPVLDEEGRPVGTLSVKRALHFLAEHAPEAILNLPPDPGEYPESREGG